MTQRELNLAGKTFRAQAETAQGTVDTETTMVFTQDTDVILATYQGGSIVTGYVLARWTGTMQVAMCYHCLTASDALQAGKGKARFDRTSDGRLAMRLDWQWLTGDRTRGESYWIAAES
ncbi:MAG: hypothetical protein AB8B93_18840 [Pseudomonadales bacterium]